ncbi:hypothetical protein EDB85DRAFT_1894414 [Lactarius pseudohatsudake]|nr:hypothetical protein EDB85DRAFT_1894414 [Lactarius pseudohatsudake]
MPLPSLHCGWGCMCAPAVAAASWLDYTWEEPLGGGIGILIVGTRGWVGRYRSTRLAAHIIRSPREHVVGHVVVVLRKGVEGSDVVMDRTNSMKYHMAKQASRVTRTV